MTPSRPFDKFVGSYHCREHHQIIYMIKETRKIFFGNVLYMINHRNIKCSDLYFFDNNIYFYIQMTADKLHSLLEHKMLANRIDNCLIHVRRLPLVFQHSGQKKGQREQQGHFQGLQLCLPHMSFFLPLCKAGPIPRTSDTG